MKFYDLKTREHVDIPEGKIKKKKIVRKTKSGEQVRHQLIGDHGGRSVYKFVGKADYDKLNVDEVK
ncbi:MAG: hypothetical protein JNK63_05705 [Chthonomonas sp.]|nr:hypothetical protein [Chthonomonas sp.]